MKLQRCILPFLSLLSMISYASRENSYPYDTPSIPWPESFGNHRAVIEVSAPAEYVSLDFEWRRPDQDVDKRRFLIVHAASGDTVKNIQRLEVTPEKCRIVFGPVSKAGKYHFYYLPYEVQGGHGVYYRNYLAPEQSPEEAWQTKQNPSPAKAKIVQVESRTAFDSFFPMEVTATSTEFAGYCKQNPGDFLLFPEDRKYPVRMRRNIPEKWLSEKQGKGFSGTASRNEYYTFQIAVAAKEKQLKNLKFEKKTLYSRKGQIDTTAITCFNLEGIDPYGKPFTKSIGVAPGQVQALWIGIDLPSDIKPGVYRGVFRVSADNMPSIDIPVNLTISNELLADRGDGEAWRHSRLRWLNSNKGINDSPTAAYTPMKAQQGTLSCLGRNFRLNTATALPSQIETWGKELLAAPARFIIEISGQAEELAASPEITERTPGRIAWTWTGENQKFKVTCHAMFEFEGRVEYTYDITPKQNTEVSDIRLEIPLKAEMARYITGIGLPGQETPGHYEGKWGSAELEVNQYGVSIPVSKNEKWIGPFDSFWLGSAEGGIHCELRGTTYSGPLLNLYRPAYPSSWHNEGRGGFRILKTSDTVTATIYSGKRLLEKSQNIRFEFAWLITPFKKINSYSQFTDRYYHNGAEPAPSDESLESGVKIINVHHANEFNPFINYPFLTASHLKTFVDEYHRKGCKVKIYYTIRELSNAAAEIWAIRSLGDEILAEGNGGGFPWLREHLSTGYTPQWYQHFDTPLNGIVADASILSAPGDSRWYNYYIEGLAWLIENTGIDGIYLDDVSYDHRILRRMRKVMDETKPGCIIDLHSNTEFSKGPVNQYAEFLPYVDKLWFGESFMYNQMSPANWLVEVSGIPFGLMGDMLHRGGNRWLGMQYGMTVRYPWMTDGLLCDPRPVWKTWDEFGIQHAGIYGFWENQPMVEASGEGVKATVYTRENKALISVGNYTDQPQETSLRIDWKRMGIDSAKARFTIPAIPDFQESQVLSTEETFTIPPRKGLLIIVE